MDNTILWDIIDGLRDEIRQRKAELDKAENFRQCMYNDMDAEVKELQAENKRLYQEHKECRLVEQVSSNRGNSSSTIQREIQDYMHHNPNCKGVRLFILPRDEFNDGVYDTRLGCSIDWDDGME